VPGPLEGVHAVVGRQRVGLRPQGLQRAEAAVQQEDGIPGTDHFGVQVDSVDAQVRHRPILAQ
jgi:hypothetical protein